MVKSMNPSERKTLVEVFCLFDWQNKETAIQENRFYIQFFIHLINVCRVCDLVAGKQVNHSLKMLLYVFTVTGERQPTVHLLRDW